MPTFSKNKRAQLDRLIPPLIAQGLQQSKIAEHLGVSRDTVNRTAKRLGLTTQPTGPRRGREHPGWNGGRRKVGRYWYVYAPDHPHTTKQRYVSEHRLVMETKLGRYLLRTEVVHHRNGDSFDNRPENLEVFPTNGDHLRYELKGRMPNWTPEGFSRIPKTIRKAAIAHQSTSGADPRIQSIHDE